MRITLVLLMLAGCGNAWANPYFVDNPYSPIPSSCFNLAHEVPLTSAALHGNSALVWQGPVNLYPTNKPRIFEPSSSAPFIFADLRIFRLGCSEPGRSALVADFTVPGGSGGQRYVLPRFYRDFNGWGGPDFVILNEPGEWKWNTGRHLAESAVWEWNTGAAREGFQAFGDFRYGPSYDGMGWFSWSFVLDQTDERITEWSSEPATARDYNDAFTLGIWHANYIDVPATTAVLQPNPALPLNGRLSGTWVVEGASDQGLVLSFSNRVSWTDDDPEQSPVFLFLSWFTFDRDGNMLWLTGEAEFAQGETRAVVPILLTGGGEFMGAAKADRAIVGQVVLTANSCNDLQFEYELSALSLGQGSQRLQRLHGLEVAGYNCRDYEARQQSLVNSP